MTYLLQLAMLEEYPKELRSRYGDALSILNGIDKTLPAPSAGLSIAVTGVGKVAAASVVSAALMTGHGTSGVISIGYCGGLADRFQLGDVLIPSSLFQYDYGAQTSRGEWLARPGERTLRYENASMEQVAYYPSKYLVDRLLSACVNACIPVARGALASGDRFVTDRNVGVSLHQTTFVDAIDMESAAVAQTCDMHGVAFAAIRVVSDICHDDSERQYRSSVDSPSARYIALLSAIIDAFLPSEASS